MCYISHSSQVPTQGNHCRSSKSGDMHDKYGCKKQCDLNIIKPPFIGNQNNHCDTKHKSWDGYVIGMNCKSPETVLKENKCDNCNYGWQTRQIYQVYYNSCGNAGVSKVTPVATWWLQTV